MPDSQTDGTGLPALEDEYRLPPIPDYLRHDLGEEYAERYQMEFIEEYKVGLVFGFVIFFQEFVILYLLNSCTRTSPSVRYQLEFIEEYKVGLGFGSVLFL